MKNIALDYGTLIIDRDKSEVLMKVGRTEEGTWVETIYSPRGGMIFLIKRNQKLLFLCLILKL